MQNKFNTDPVDVYSKPIGNRKTKLSIIFKMQVREKPEKPGRSVAVVWDKRIPLILGFENAYSYTVTFSDVGKLAGNHYHVKKSELYYPLSGNFKVLLEDIKTKEREELLLETKSHEVAYIPAGVAHTVVSKTNTAILLVTATYPNILEDEFEYKIF